MDFGQLTLDVKSGVGWITVNRPDKLNALNAEIFRDFHKVLDAAFEDKGAQVIVITGAGEKAFVAGADIEELAAMNAVTGKETSEIGQRVFDRIENASKPVIAAVNGYALGGGCELALCCHIRLCSESAQFGIPEVGLGIIPGYGGTQRLSRLIGKGRAMELALTGDYVKAETALQIGLANKVFPATDFLGAVKTYIDKKILTKGPLALRYAIETVNASAETDLKTGQALEAGLFGLLSATEDMHEGMTAFLEKRKPNFHGK